MERYFNGKTELERDDVQMLLSGVQNVDSPLYKIFQSKKAEITKIMPADKYEALDKNIKLNSVIKKSYNVDTKKWDDSYYMTEATKFLTKDKVAKILTRAKSNRALEDKDIPTYEKLTMELCKDTSASSSDF